MAEATSTFTLDLQDGVSSSARDAAQALTELKAKLKADTEALKEMQKAMRNLRGSTTTSKEEFQSMRDAIAAQRATIGNSQQRIISLGGAFDSAGGSAKKMSESTSGLSDGLSGASGPMGSVLSGLGRMKSLLLSPIGLVTALATGFIALSVAVLKSVIALAKFAITSSSARREERLQLEGVNTLLRARGRFTAGVGDMQEAIDRAADSTSIGRDKLAGFARQLERFGVRGPALADAVSAMGIAAQVQGERGGRRFLFMARQAQLTGGSIADVAARFRNQLGPIARRQMASLGNQSQRLRSNISNIFSGLNLDPFLNQLQKIGDLFSQSTVQGRALKQIVISLFQPAIDQATDATPVIIRLFKEGVLGAVKLASRVEDLRQFFLRIAVTVLRAKRVMEEFFGSIGGGNEVARSIQRNETSAARASGNLANSISSSFRNQLGINSPSRVFAGFGSNIVDGIVGGIEGGIRSVARASRRLAGSASDTFKSALDINSPSRVFTAFGANISEGVSLGVDSGAGDVDRSVSDLVSVPSQSSSQSTVAGSGAVSISFGDIILQGGEPSEQSALSFRDELVRVLSSVSIELGVA